MSRSWPNVGFSLRRCTNSSAARRKVAMSLLHCSSSLRRAGAFFVCFTLGFIRGQRKRCTWNELRLWIGYNFRILRSRSAQQLKLRQHQTTNGETNVVIQHAELLRNNTLRNPFERAFQFPPCGRSIVGDDHLEILTAADPASRMVLQQHARLFVNSSSGNDDQMRSFGVDLEIDNR